MSEVNGPKISVSQLNYAGIQKLISEVSEVTSEVEETLPQLTDFSDNKAEALGRSMLFKGIDDVNNDLKTLLENPQIAENSDEMFEIAYKIAEQNGDANPYEAASSFSTTSI